MRHAGFGVIILKSNHFLVSPFLTGVKGIRSLLIYSFRLPVPAPALLRHAQCHFQRIRLLCLPI